MNLFTRKEISMIKEYIDHQKEEIKKGERYTSSVEFENVRKKIKVLNDTYKIMSKNNFIE